MLVGEEMLEHFRNSTVAVIGVGGVGGYAAEMIVRAGVGRLIILDSDDVSVTNKNRQLLALDSTVGKPKCDVLAARLKDINPDLDLIVTHDDEIVDGIMQVIPEEEGLTDLHHHLRRRPSRDLGHLR